MAEIARRTGVPHDSVLRDHALSYMLAGIAATLALAEGAIVKDGTALRKCYFPGYRYSQDLDFSSRDRRVETTGQLTDLLEAGRDTARALAETIKAPYTFAPRRQRHRDDRSHTQHDHRITVECPTGASLPIRFELTHMEPIVCPIEVRPVAHEFADEPFAVTMPVYARDEVVLEKLARLPADCNQPRSA